MAYTPIPTELPGVLLLEPKTFTDERGFFYESFNRAEFRRVTGLDVEFVQDNHSRSVRGALRGLHYQIKHAQGKLVRVIAGEVQDVVVDLRKSSPHFGKHFSINLSADDKRQLWIPPGFAHGILVLSESADILYKTTDYWHPEHERTILWNDKDLDVRWHTELPLLSAKDATGSRFATAETYA